MGITRQSLGMDTGEAQAKRSMQQRKDEASPPRSTDKETIPSGKEKATDPVWQAMVAQGAV